MKSLAKLAIVLAQISMLLAAARASDEEFHGVKIQVIDQAGVPTKQWHAAELFANEKLQTAGVSVKWTLCLWNPNTGNADCPQSEAPNQITLLVVSEQVARRLQGHSHAFGMALVLPKGSFATRGYVFYDRIQNKCAEDYHIQKASLLGAVMAHEIGHLLLGTNSHSRSGIMKPELDASDVPGVRLFMLSFDGRESEALRVAVANRIQASH